MGGLGTLWLFFHFWGLKPLGSPSCTAPPGASGGRMHTIFLHAPALRPSHCGDSENQADGQPWIQIGVGSRWVVRPRTFHAPPRAVWKLQRTLDHGKQLCLETGEEMQLAVVYTQPFTDAVSECF